MNEIMNALNRKIGKINLSLKRRSPEILLAAGIAGVVTSAVMACKATTKLSAVLEESKKPIDELHEYVEKTGFSEKYSEEDSRKDLTIMYTQAGVKIVKLYAPSVILGTLSIASILAGHNILRKRNVALAAAYTVVDKSFKDYRSRVVERFGEKLDKELKYGIKSQEIEETVVDEKGKEKTVKKTVDVVDPDEISEYAKFFTVGNPNWTKDPEYNLTFLRRQQDYANHVLKLKGYLFLNDVYEMLGIDKTKAGNVVGWVYDEEHPNGDNYVDFGIYNGNEANCRFVNGWEQTILLDFNIDGPILDIAF